MNHLIPNNVFPFICPAVSLPRRRTGLAPVISLDSRRKPGPTRIAILVSINVAVFLAAAAAFLAIVRLSYDFDRNFIPPWPAW